VAVVSLKGSNCLKVKRGAMRRTGDGIEYLCGLCRGQFGYRVPQKPARVTA
jgi:hypothetical protein